MGFSSMLETGSRTNTFPLSFCLADACARVDTPDIIARATTSPATHRHARTVARVISSANTTTSASAPRVSDHSADSFLFFPRRYRAIKSPPGPSEAPAETRNFFPISTYHLPRCRPSSSSSSSSSSKREKERDSAGPPFPPDRLGDRDSTIGGPIYGGIIGRSISPPRAPSPPPPLSSPRVPLLRSDSRISRMSYPPVKNAP